MPPEASSSEESREEPKQVNLVEEETSTSHQAFRKAARKVLLVQQGIPRGRIISAETSDGIVKQIKLIEQGMRTSREVSSEESREAVKQVNLVEQETCNSRRASPSSSSMMGGSNTSFQTEMTHALQHYFSRKSSVRSEDIKDVAEEPDVEKT